MNQPIALSDYLRTVQGVPRRRRWSAQDSQGAGEADAGAQTTAQDVSLAGRAQLAQSSVPGIAARAVGMLGLPGSLMGLGIRGAMAHNEYALNKGLENLDEQAVANIMDTPIAQSARFGETPGPGGYAQAAGWGLGRAGDQFAFGGPKQGIGVDPTDEGPGIAAAIADATAASAAATAAAADSAGVGPAGVGGFGDAYHTGGLVRNRRPGMNEPITAQQGEYVIKRSAVKHYGQSLLDAINRAEADVKVVRKPRDLKTALTASRT